MPSTELSCRGRPGRSRRPSSGRDRADGAGQTAAVPDSATALTCRPRPDRSQSPPPGRVRVWWRRRRLLEPAVGVRAYAFDRAIMPGEAGPEPTTVIGPRSDLMQSMHDQRSVQAGRRGGLTDSRRHSVGSCLPSKPASPPSATHRRGPR